MGDVRPRRSGSGKVEICGASWRTTGPEQARSMDREEVEMPRRAGRVRAVAGRERHGGGGCGRHIGISEATLWRWKKKFAHLG